MTPDNPIGVFDSGVGGLSVLREIRALLPGEDLLYIADSGHLPYGAKSAAYIRRRAVALTDFLVTRGVKAVVVACNTATAAAAAELRALFSVPIIGMEPAVKPAAATTRSGIVGVLATAGTLASDKFAALVARHGHKIRVITQPCPGLVEAVERCELDTAATRRLVDGFVQPLTVAGADTLVLGCTHYPFVTPLIRACAGPDVTVADAGEPVARELRRRLAGVDLLRAAARSGGEQFWTSGDPPLVAAAIGRLWGSAVQVHHLPVAVAAVTA